MEKKLSISILSPYKVILQRDTEMALLPESNGEIGILPYHISLIASLGPGVIKLYNRNKIDYTLFIAGGFVKIDQNQINVLVSFYSEIKDLHSKIAKKELSDFEDELATSENSEYLDYIFKEINVRRKIIEITDKL